MNVTEILVENLGIEYQILGVQEYGDVVLL
jgi:hypothetical protein